MLKELFFICYLLFRHLVAICCDSEFLWKFLWNSFHEFYCEISFSLQLAVRFSWGHPLLTNIYTHTLELWMKLMFISWLKFVVTAVVQSSHLSIEACFNYTVKSINIGRVMWHFVAYLWRILSKVTVNMNNLFSQYRQLAWVSHLCGAGCCVCWWSKLEMSSND